MKIPSVWTTPERRRAVYEEVVGMSTPRKSFYLMVALSTTIAAYGLLSNSTAVVIGAMLVAPLMGPIFGIALSLSAGDPVLLRRAVVAEVCGVLLCVAVGALIGLVPLRLGFGSEIMARTQPTLYDIIIALASGLAGAYALMDERISPALPGVAIATALVPPLTTCGLCLSAARWGWAFGAFLLFFANFLAIEIAAAIVFTVFGMAGMKTEESFTFVRFLRRFSLSLVALVVVAAFMTQTLLALIAERRLSRAIEKTLTQEVRSAVGARLSEFRAEERNSALEVVATVLTPQEFEPTQVARIEEVLRQRVDPRLRLVVRSLISKDADRHGAVFVAEEERERRAQVAEQTQFLTQTSQVLNAQLKWVTGARLTDVRRERTNGQTVVTAIVRTPTAIEPAQVADIEDALRKTVGSSVRLIVRSILTRDADAQRFIYEPEKEEPKPLTGEALKLRRRLGAALKNQLKQLAEGASLIEFRYAPRGGRLLLFAVARTPRQIESAQVKRMEEALRRHVQPNVDLIVRSVVGTDAAASGYLSSFDETKLTPQIESR